MSRIVFVNGRYELYQEAHIHVEDRGFQFADGVYEVMEVFEGKIVDERRHMTRLERSMDEIHLSAPMGLKALHNILRETIRRNRVRNGSVYLQVTRGTARRDFVFPSVDVTPSVICIARSACRGASDEIAANGINVISMPDIRWRRPDIKTIGLLPNALARQAAKEAGAREAWLVDEQGYVTEGAASNAWIVDKDDVLITRPIGEGILSGVTRGVVLEIASKQGLKVVERAFSIGEALVAKEAFVTAATALVMPVVRIDDHVIGNGVPGSFTNILRQHFHAHAEFTR